MKKRWTFALSTAALAVSTTFFAKNYQSIGVELQNEINACQANRADKDCREAIQRNDAILKSGRKRFWYTVQKRIIPHNLFS